MKIPIPTPVLTGSGSKGSQKASQDRQVVAAGPPQVGNRLYSVLIECPFVSTMGECSRPLGWRSRLLSTCSFRLNYCPRVKVTVVLLVTGCGELLTAVVKTKHEGCFFTL